MPPKAKPAAPEFPPYRLARTADLVPFANNARKHTQAQVDLVARMITEYRWTNPVLVDGKGGIIAGHCRVLAAKQLGLETVPTIELSHLNAAQRRAYVIADNQAALAGSTWDDELLRIELTELGLEGFDLSLVGFSDEAIEALNAPDIDPAAEWQGMPEFDQPDAMAFHTLTVHFKDQEAVDAFARLLGQTITKTTKFTWFPRIARENFMDERYESSVSDLHPVQGAA